MDLQYINTLKQSKDNNQIKESIKSIISAIENQESTGDQTKIFNLLDEYKRLGVIDTLLQILYPSKDLQLSLRILEVLQKITSNIDYYDTFYESTDNNQFYDYMITLLNNNEKSLSENSFTILLNIMDHDKDLNQYIIGLGFFYELNRFMTSKKSFKLPIKRYISIIFKDNNVPIKEVTDYILGWKDSDLNLHLLDIISQRRDIKDFTLLPFYKFNDVFKSQLDTLEKLITNNDNNNNNNNNNNTKEIELIYRIYYNFSSNPDVLNIELLNMSERLGNIMIKSPSLLGLESKRYIFKCTTLFLKHFENEIIIENGLLDSYLKQIDFVLNNPSIESMIKLDAMNCLNLFLTNLTSVDIKVISKLFDNNILKGYNSLNKQSAYDSLKPFIEAGLQEFDEIYYLSKMNFSESEFKSLKYNP